LGRKEAQKTQNKRRRRKMTKTGTKTRKAAAGVVITSSGPAAGNAECGMRNAEKNGSCAAGPGKTVDVAASNGAAAAAPEMSETQRRHEELKAVVKERQERVDALLREGGFYKKHLSEDMRDHLMEVFDKKINEYIAGLEIIVKADLEKMQGRISGLREAHEIISGVAGDRELTTARGYLADAKAELRRYEEENALLLYGEQQEGRSQESGVRSQEEESGKDGNADKSAAALFEVPDGKTMLAIVTEVLELGNITTGEKGNPEHQKLFDAMNAAGFSWEGETNEDGREVYSADISDPARALMAELEAAVVNGKKPEADLVKGLRAVTQEELDGMLKVMEPEEEEEEEFAAAATEEEEEEKDIREEALELEAKLNGNEAEDVKEDEGEEAGPEVEMEGQGQEDLALKPEALGTGDAGEHGEQGTIGMRNAECGMRNEGNTAAEMDSEKEGKTAAPALCSVVTKILKGEDKDLIVTLQGLGLDVARTSTRDKEQTWTAPWTRELEAAAGALVKNDARVKETYSK
jgi:hypothetical protein